jgi:hypothetical protein
MGLGDVMSLLWAECEAEGGMHFCGQRSVAVELIDPASGAVLPWEEGVRGEAVYTTFAREATPVLRYRSADHLVVTAMSCPCGRTSPRIRCVGRTDDMLIYKAMNVFPRSRSTWRPHPGSPRGAARRWPAPSSASCGPGCRSARMNSYGCSLVYGHPQGPTGARLIVELLHTLRLRGGGIGLFTGCAAGDTGAAVVVRVED